LRANLVRRSGGGWLLLFFAYSASLHFGAFVLTLASFLASGFRWTVFP
jgi:hypothetical protein